MVVKNTQVFIFLGHLHAQPIPVESNFLSLYVYMSLLDIYMLAR